jgi:hypothetical protein
MGTVTDRPAPLLDLDRAEPMTHYVVEKVLNFDDANLTKDFNVCCVDSSSIFKRLSVETSGIALIFQ